MINHAFFFQREKKLYGETNCLDIFKIIVKWKHLNSFFQGKQLLRVNVK